MTGEAFDAEAFIASLPERARNASPAAATEATPPADADHFDPVALAREIHSGTPDLDAVLADILG